MKKKVKSMKLAILIFSAIILVFTALSVLLLSINGRAKGEGSRMTLLNLSELFGGSFFQTRIPGMVITDKETLLCYYEGRTGTGDWSPSDILLYRSVDGGRSFEEKVLVKGKKDGKLINNPVMIVGGEGLIHFLYEVEYGVEERGGRLFYARSTDDGVSFSEPVDITEAVLPKDANAFAFGPGHGIFTKNGVLILPVWYVPTKAGAELTAHQPSVVSVIFSNDNGETWQKGDDLPTDNKTPSESTIVQLSDGSFMMNVRWKTGDGCRGVAYSRNGISDWTEIKPEKSLSDPTCFGSLTEANGELYFVNCDDKSVRSKLTVKKSGNDGKSWDKVAEIERGLAGYADIAVKNGRVYVLYESYSGFKNYLVSFEPDKIDKNKPLHNDVSIVGLAFSALSIITAIVLFVYIFVKKRKRK